MNGESHARRRVRGREEIADVEKALNVAQAFGRIVDWQHNPPNANDLTHRVMNGVLRRDVQENGGTMLDILLKRLW